LEAVGWMLSFTASVTPARALDRIRVMGAALRITATISSTSAKTRVGGINLANPRHVRVRRDAAPRSRWGKRLCRCGAASGSSKYLQPDPLITKVPRHRDAVYAYARNNPVLRFDATGLIVTNDSDGDVWVKPEDGDWFNLPPGTTWDGSPDGVISTESGDQAAYYGKSWLPDNDVRVGPNGDIECTGGLCGLLPEKPWPNPFDNPSWFPPMTPPPSPEPHGCGKR
jgi:hypothetical protein